MKTLEDLKTFCLDKKQMNEATGGANNGCDYVVMQMNTWSIGQMQKKTNGQKSYLI